jgi:hypothetical protein
VDKGKIGWKVADTIIVRVAVERYRYPFFEIVAVSLKGLSFLKFGTGGSWRLLSRSDTRWMPLFHRRSSAIQN